MTTAKEIKKTLTNALDCKVYVKAFDGTYRDRGHKFVAIGFSANVSEVFDRIIALYPNVEMISGCQAQLRIS